MSDNRIHYDKPKLIECPVGDRRFYRRSLRIAVPIVIQNAVSNFVSLLDNLMIGLLGTEQMAGASIANQLILIFNLAVFGAISGIGIFTTQFFGSKDTNGIRHTFRFKFLITMGIGIIGILTFLFFGEPLLRLYLTDDGSGTDLALTLSSGLSYLKTILFGLIPFAIAQVYAGTLREGGESRVPMISSLTAIIVNLLFNYILIFGKLGCPALGIKGAAIATVLSRYVELAIVAVYTHLNSSRWEFVKGAFQNLFSIPSTLIRKIVIRGTPLLVNEILWAVGIAKVMQNYSARGLTVVAAVTIASTVTNLFNSIYFGIGASISIIAGQSLGANRPGDALRDAWRMITLAVVSCFVLGSILASVSPFIPNIYKTEPEVREMASGFLLIASICMPIGAFVNGSYFTIRSGGKTFITFLFDSAFMLCFSVTFSYILSVKTDLPILWVYLIVTLLDILKGIAGFILIKTGIWLNNIVSDAESSSVS